MFMLYTKFFINLNTRVISKLLLKVVQVQNTIQAYLFQKEYWNFSSNYST